jgi:hypothetical protein
MPAFGSPRVITNLNELTDLPFEAIPIRIILQIPELSHEEHAKWQREINAYMNACGCGEGAAFLVTALLLLLLTAFSLWSVARVYPVRFGVLSMMLVCGSVGVGKWFGKMRAAGKWRRSIAALHALLAVRSSEPRVAYVSKQPIITTGGLR